MADVRKRLSDKTFHRDYFDQCLAGIGAFEYADRLEARLDKFDLYAGDSLNPLSAAGKCGELECRIAYAHEFREAIAASRPDTVLTGKGAMDLVRQYNEVFRKHFAQCAEGVVFDAHMGSRCNTTVATNALEEAVGYRLLDRRKVGVTLPNWSMLRTVPLPALQHLTAPQAMQVREEAEKAMPAFRAMLQRDLMSLKDVSDGAEEKRALEVAAELRVAARDLQGQLAGVRLPSIRRSEKLFATLAFALEIVALSTGNPAAMAAVTGTFAALMLAAHKSERDRQEKQEVLVHQPAYVLLTAERIHAVRH